MSGFRLPRYSDWNYSDSDPDSDIEEVIPATRVYAERLPIDVQFVELQDDLIERLEPPRPPRQFAHRDRFQASRSYPREPPRQPAQPREPQRALPAFEAPPQQTRYKLRSSRTENDPAQQSPRARAISRNLTATVVAPKRTRPRRRSPLAAYKVPVGDVLEDPVVISDDDEEAAEQRPLRRGERDAATTVAAIPPTPVVPSRENDAPSLGRRGEPTTALRQREERATSAVPDDPSSSSVPAGEKRKASPPPPVNFGDPKATVEGRLANLAIEITTELDSRAPDETIHLCGMAALEILDTRPIEVLELARDKLHTWPYSEVHVCWRRLLEDATLMRVAEMLRVRAGVSETPHPKRQKTDETSTPVDLNAAPVDWLAEIVRELDVGMSMSGSPGRRLTFYAVLEQLEGFVPTQENALQVPSRFDIARPSEIEIDKSFTRVQGRLTFQAFQHHLYTNTTPIIIPGAIAQWQALTKWQDPNYFLSHTLGGRRVVPIEVGKMYTDENWSQKLLTFHEFLTTYLLPASPPEIAYLAQHDLFSQMPKLRDDFQIPDYCYTDPPTPQGAASNTAGLATTPQLDEPTLNIWLGPKGTKTPLHTDPYHNILCQVVGYKYVLLFPPQASDKLYPRGVDEKGNNMSNTSQVDVSSTVPRELLEGEEYLREELLDERLKVFEEFPGFKEANHYEAVLAPGECLYVPLGWWHYVESLTTSVSVSFWWN